MKPDEEQLTVTWYSFLIKFSGNDVPRAPSSLCFVHYGTLDEESSLGGVCQEEKHIKS